MTYRSRNSKLTKDGSEIIMESIKFRLQYDKSFIINERYLPRKLKIYNNNHINSIANLQNYSYLNRHPPLSLRENSFYNNSSTKDLKTTESCSSKQPLKSFSPRKSNQNSQVNDDYYTAPFKRTNKPLNKRPPTTEFLKEPPHGAVELPSIHNESQYSTAKNHHFQNLKKRTSKMRLRNLLDSGSELNFKASTEKFNAYIIPENFQDRLIYMTEKAYEKQLKQIDSYKEFKAKLGYSFSKRVPLASLHPNAPNFMVLPISRYNPANLEIIDTERGRDQELYENVSDTEAEVNENLYAGVSFHGSSSSRRSKISGKEDSMLENEFVIEKGERLKVGQISDSWNAKRYDLEKLQVYGPDILKNKNKEEDEDLGKVFNLVVVDGAEVSQVLEIGDKDGVLIDEGVDNNNYEIVDKE